MSREREIKLGRLTVLTRELTVLELKINTLGDALRNEIAASPPARWNMDRIGMLGEDIARARGKLQSIGSEARELKSDLGIG